MTWRGADCALRLSGVALALSGTVLAAPASAQDYERVLGGISLNSRSSSVLAKYGNPNEVIIGEVGVRGAPVQPGAGGAGAGGVGGVGGPGFGGRGDFGGAGGEYGGPTPGGFGGPAGFGAPPGVSGFGGPTPGGFGAVPGAPSGFGGPTPGGFGAVPGAPSGFGGPTPGGFGAVPGAPSGFGGPTPGGFGAVPGAPSGFGGPTPGGFGAVPGAPGGGLGGRGGFGESGGEFGDPRGGVGGLGGFGGGPSVGQFGQTISTLARQQEVTWIYNRKVNNNLVSYEFLIGPSGAVIQIRISGYYGGNSRTRRGIALGSTYKEVVQKYGYPEEHYQVGRILVASYRNRAHCQFQFLAEAPQSNPLATGNKVVAITIATVE